MKKVFKCLVLIWVLVALAAVRCEAFFGVSSGGSSVSGYVTITSSVSKNISELYGKIAHKPVTTTSNVTLTLTGNPILNNQYFFSNDGTSTFTVVTPKGTNINIPSKTIVVLFGGDDGTLLQNVFLPFEIDKAIDYFSIIGDYVYFGYRTAGTYGMIASKDVVVDVVIAGGGGGCYVRNDVYPPRGSAGGGGRVKVRNNVSVTKGRTLSLTVGDAGTSGSSPTSGGTTSLTISGGILSVSASGGGAGGEEYSGNSGFEDTTYNGGAWVACSFMGESFYVTGGGAGATGNGGNGACLYACGSSGTGYTAFGLFALSYGGEGFIPPYGVCSPEPPHTETFAGHGCGGGGLSQAGTVLFKMHKNYLRLKP